MDDRFFTFPWHLSNISRTRDDDTVRCLAEESEQKASKGEQSANSARKNAVYLYVCIQSVLKNRAKKGLFLFEKKI